MRASTAVAILCLAAEVALSVALPLPAGNAAGRPKRPETNPQPTRDRRLRFVPVNPPLGLVFEHSNLATEAANAAAAADRTKFNRKGRPSELRMGDEPPASHPPGQPLPPPGSSRKQPSSSSNLQPGYKPPASHPSRPSLPSLAQLQLHEPLPNERVILPPLKLSPNQNSPGSSSKPPGLSWKQPSSSSNLQPGYEPPALHPPPQSLPSFAELQLNAWPPHGLVGPGRPPLQNSPASFSNPPGSFSKPSGSGWGGSRQPKHRRYFNQFPDLQSGYKAPASHLPESSSKPPGSSSN